MAIRYKRLPFLREFTDNILTGLDLQFNKNGLNELLDELIMNKEKRVTYNDSPVLKVHNKKVLTLDDCMQYFSTLSDRQFDRINSIETLKSVLSGILVRDEMIKDAKGLGLDRSRSFQDTFKQEYTSLILRKTVGQMGPSQGVNWQQEYFKFRDKIALNNDILIDSINKIFSTY